jgi:hypothetical protein
LLFFFLYVVCDLYNESTCFQLVDVWFCFEFSVIVLFCAYNYVYIATRKFSWCKLRTYKKVSYSKWIFLFSAFFCMSFIIVFYIELFSVLFIYFLLIFVKFFKLIIYLCIYLFIYLCIYLFVYLLIIFYLRIFFFQGTFTASVM